MIVLKHLAREFDINPHKLRAVLRGIYGKTKGRWKWEDEDPSLATIRSHLKSYVENTSSLLEPSTTIPASSGTTKPTRSHRASSSASSKAANSSASQKSKKRS